MKDFFTNNIENKKQFLQEEHKKILEIIYKDAVDSGCVKGYSYDLNLSQCMRYTKIENESGYNVQILVVCLSDLESMGFIMNVMKNPMYENSYGITWLGLKYMEKYSDRAN